MPDYQYIINLHKNHEIFTILKIINNKQIKVENK